MVINEQISELNNEVRCHIKPSQIHGVGVHALRDIQKGEKLYISPNITPKWYSIPYERLNELRPEIREVVLARWPSVLLGSMFRSPNDDVWLASFVNHSGEPNYDLATDTALKDIKAGEEVTENYKLMKNYGIIYPWLNE